MIEQVFGRMDAIVKKRRELDAMEAEWLRELAEYDRSEEWRADGYLSCAAALRDRCRMNPGAAHGHVELARKLDDLPAVAQAFEQGAVSREHVRVITSAATPERAAALADVESQLVHVASTYTPKALSGVVRYLTDAIDGDGGAGTDERLYARRRLHVSRIADDMLVLDGLCDPADARVFETALTAEMERDRVEADPRTPAQRRMDALTNILRRSLDTGSLGSTRKVRPHVTEIIDLTRQPGATPELVEEIRTERRINGRLSRATLDRIRCDCSLTRVLMAGDSEILDVGRATRTISRAQWTALVARDGGCVVAGCDRAPEMCEAHHTREWREGGNTDIENLELVCWQHHRQRHAHDDRRRARSRAPDD